MAVLGACVNYLDNASCTKVAHRVRSSYSFDKNLLIKPGTPPCAKQCEEQSALKFVVACTFISISYYSAASTTLQINLEYSI